MNIHPIKTEADYQATLLDIDKLLQNLGQCQLAQQNFAQGKVVGYNDSSKDYFSRAYIC